LATAVNSNANLERFTAPAANLAVCISGSSEVDEKTGGCEQKIWLLMGRDTRREDWGN
jgi:hypothetical protein